MKTQVPVLIVEDRNHTAAILRKNVNSDPTLNVCAIAFNVETGCQFLEKFKPRVVLVDLGLPDGSGIEVIEAASKCDWECDCFVISIFGDEGRVFEALQAGAKGYIQKNDSAANIAASINDLIQGGSPMSPKIARLLLSKVHSATVKKPVFDGDCALSSRELEVIDLVAKGYKRKEVADQLSITVGTVGNHIHRIYSKLGVNSNTEAIVAATRKGLLR